MTEARLQDDEVSAAYSELAVEHCPAELSEKILRMAAQQAQHRGYKRSLRWTRPFAWAATIALCLAITLELARTPQPDAVEEPPSSRSRSYIDNPASSPPEAQAASSASAGEVSAATESEPAATADVAAAETAEKFAEERTARNEAGAPALQDLESAARDKLEAPDEEVVSPQNDPKKAIIMRQSAARLSAAVAPTAACTEQERAAPESWLQCIRALEERGDIEQASQEREALIEVFPDFKMP